MFYLQNILEIITSSNKIFILVLLLLLFISILLFYMIYSQNKAMVEELKRKQEKENTKIESTIPKEEPSIISLNEVLKEEVLEQTPVFNLESVTKELKELPKEEKNIQLTSYEAEQEEKAIISYEELVAKNNMASISYSDEIQSDDIFVKKVDLENTGKIELDPIKKEINSKVPVMLYEHEEDFLKALKQLQNLLN